MNEQEFNQALETKTFLDKMGNTFHIRLLKYYYLITVDKEENLDDDILFFTFNEGDYSIRYIDLKKKADEETLLFIQRHKVSMNDKNGPVI